VGVEIVLNENDFLGLREVAIGEIFQGVSIVHGSVTIGDFDMPPAFERREHHEEVGRPVALVFVVEAGMVELGWRPGFILIGVRVSAISCFEVSSRQTNGRLPSRGRV
jgi:hypothetical protein